MTIVTQTYNNIEYIISGSDPKILLLSGMHGDEYEVAECQKKYLSSRIDTLPSLLYIPIASPTATLAKSRTNKDGHDINRSFIEPANDEEASAIMHIISPYHFDLCINLHEDPDRTNSFYLYDTNVMDKQTLEAFQNTIRETGTLLYNGIDDLEDLYLGLNVVEGYVSTLVTPYKHQAGFLSDWLLMQGKAKRVLVPEVPGKASIDQKQKIVNAILDFFVHQ